VGQARQKRLRVVAAAPGEPIEVSIGDRTARRLSRLSSVAAGAAAAANAAVLTANAADKEFKDAVLAVLESNGVEVDLQTQGVKPDLDRVDGPVLLVVPLQQQPAPNESDPPAGG
jgi:hypothetical protein